MKRFNYAVLLIDGQLLAARAVSKGWKIIDPRHLPGDKGRSVCVFVGGSEIMGTRAALPAARDAEVRRAVPFAIEDDVAADISETHFALGAKLPETAQRDVRIASNALMERWTTALENYGMKNAPIYFAADVLPENTLLESNAYIYGRINNRTFCFDRDLPRDVFVAMTQDVGELKVYGERLASELGVAPAGGGVTTNEELLTRLSEMQLADGAVNLRQGAYSVKRSVSTQQIRDWQRTAALIVLAAVVWFATLVSGTRALDARSNEIQAATNQILRAEFPEAGGDYNRVLDLYRAGVGGAEQPLPSVVDVSALLYKAVDESERAEIRSFRYDAKRREAICVVSAQDFAALEAISDALRMGGLSVSGGDARQDRGAVVGEFKLGAS